MITKNLEDFKEFISVESSFDGQGFKKIQPFLKSVYQNKLVKLIGKEQVIRFTQYSESDEIIQQAVKFAKEVETNLAMYDYSPFGGVQITSGGINRVAPRNQESASTNDIRDLQRYYKKAGLIALDNLFELMEDNEQLFEPWKNSKQYTKFKSLLVNSTQDFQEHYNIFDSRQTFVSLSNELETVEYQYIIPIITEGVLKDLKRSTIENEVVQDVKKYVSKAIVFYTVSKTLGSGMYFQESEGFKLRFDLLDYERQYSSKSTLNEHIKTQIKQKQEEAHNFLKLAKNLIQDDSELFPSYTPKQNQAPSPFINGKGVLGL
ncbi:hypothetical protein SAMN04489761_3072 [Tenacibaculum sp. MAR_2009_124]|uniref:DUF6712 family protein n=1 Tax=Tenacibaculum sp. MAR_2009_124 TaxID=1250059 RepID=UPI000898C004|nr:DUF6712 family protein [Tenacibaculum sp. MAR_2009_124]SEC46638.1 hypothetical protein SAMN04489761_3072 [Tenacibaculum sp. MAR_2009_124]